MKATIPAKYLAALSPFVAPEKDGRACLMGIHIKQGIAEASDGHRLVRIEADDIECDDDIILALSTDQARAVKARKSADQVVTINGAFELCETRSPARVIDATFPDLDRVIPADWVTDWFGNGGYNADYLGSFAGVAKTLGCSRGCVKLRPRGDGAMRVEFPAVMTKVVAAVMPMRI